MKTLNFLENWVFFVFSGCLKSLQKIFAQRIFCKDDFRLNLCKTLKRWHRKRADNTVVAIALCYFYFKQPYFHSILIRL